MISYTKRYVNIVSLIITILIYIFLIKSNLIQNKIDFNTHFISSIFKRSSVLVELTTHNINQDTKEDSKIQNNYPNVTKEESKIQNNYPNITKEENLQTINEESNWKIIIPKISLEASISEGTSKEIMDKYVGHFEETSLKSGNVGLAAHNRGYAVNYFARIKELKEGNEIIYKYYDFEKIYTVVENKIIKDTDWEDLEETKENKITLITCVENEPEYRRCIQGIEKDKGGN